MTVLARYFGFSERGATLAGEMRGGLTTFMVMSSGRAGPCARVWYATRTVG